MNVLKRLCKTVYLMLYPDVLVICGIITLIDAILKDQRSLDIIIWHNFVFVFIVCSVFDYIVAKWKEAE